MLRHGELRRHPRTAVRIKVRVGWTQEDGTRGHIQGFAVNVSEGGMRVESYEPIPNRLVVQFEMIGVSFRGCGIVRASGRRGVWHWASIAFQGGLSWKPERKSDPVEDPLPTVPGA